MGRKLDLTRDYGVSMSVGEPTTFIQDDVVFDTNGNEIMPLVPHDQPEPSKRKVLPKTPASVEESANMSEIEKQLGLN